MPGCTARSTPCASGESGASATTPTGWVSTRLSPTWGVEVPGRRITLLGAGGAAKAVALKLVQQGAGPITVCNRTPQKAEALCNLAKGRMGHIGFALEDLRRGARDCDILINCTSLGMTGTNSQFRDLSFLDELPGHAAVFDLIYSPAETELLRQARLRG